MSISRDTRGAKQSYAKPNLTVYGSVRDLTGSNSGLNTGDGNTMMP